MFEELRCPNETCYGWVSEVEESSTSKFYGCGSCGNVWSNLDQLRESIEQIISKYAYRQKVYQKSNNVWQGVDLDDEPEDYEELVASEWNNV